MSRWVDKTATKKARLVNLYNFLLVRHPKEVIREGDSLRLCCNHSVSIKQGYSGFYDFSDGGHGNSVDCLTAYFDYGLPDAVEALCSFAAEHPDLAASLSNAPVGHTLTGASKAVQKPSEPTKQPFTPPMPIEGEFRQLSDYLIQHRGIPPSLVQTLINDGLLYQEKEHNNIVFIDPAKTFVELRGSDRLRPFHRVGFSDLAAFWWFKPRGIQTHATRAFVCEGAIDAISLYLYMSLWDENRAEEALYCGIGGVANQQRIDRIRAGMAMAGCETIIAVDNDEAGEKCRQRNSDCRAFIPRLKDWNEDLLDFMDEHSNINILEILCQKVESHRNMG